MAEYQIVVDGFLNEPLTGRRPIETPETEINRANVLKVVMGKAEPIHLLNKNEIRFLHNYYLGSQPVLHRTKEYHAEITNRIVENHANECVGFYTGYMSGTPCSYVRSETATGDGEEMSFHHSEISLESISSFVVDSRKQPHELSQYAITTSVSFLISYP